MLDLRGSADDVVLAGLARSIGVDLLDPVAREAERLGEVPGRVRAKLESTGLADGYLDGGPEAVPSAVAHVAIVEGLAYGDGGLAMAAALGGAAELLLALHGTPDQVAAAVAARLRGARCAVAHYEGFGRSPGDYLTTITSVAGGAVHVLGTKVAVSMAAKADPLVVVGQDPDGALRAVVLPAGSVGVAVRAAAGSLALGAAQLGELRVDATVDASALLGGPTSNDSALLASVQRIRLLAAAAVIGTGQRAVDYASEYATGRVAFGRPIAGFQGVSFPLAEAHTRLEQARLETALAASALDAGRGEGPAVTLAVSYASSAGTEATRTAVQTLGGHGFIADHPVERWYRTAAALSALDFDAALAPFVPAL
jgi:alkylation response protein AidB-like acyl-CoA dehydrogenase